MDKHRRINCSQYKKYVKQKNYGNGLVYIIKEQHIDIFNFNLLTRNI